MNFRTRKLVKPEDLNPRLSLFGGKLLQWIDEEAAIFTMCQLETKNIVTKFISDVNFLAPAISGDVVEIGIQVVSFGRTSLTLKVIVRNKDTQDAIVIIDKIVFVSLDNNGKPIPHNKSVEKI